MLIFAANTITRECLSWQKDNGPDGIKSLNEWADYLPWGTVGITTPEQVRAFFAERGRTQLRSDDPTMVALRNGNTVTDWRDLYTFARPNVKGKESTTIDEWNGIDTGLLLACFV